nr:unnamed protein product [Callosobruchus chinensis]
MVQACCEQDLKKSTVDNNRSPLENNSIQCESGPSEVCRNTYDSDCVYESSGSDYQPSQSESESDDEYNIYIEPTRSALKADTEQNVKTPIASLDGIEEMFNT